MVVTASPLSRLNEFVAKQEAVSDTLPFIHLTNTYKFDKIAASDIIKTERCRYFKEELIYLFYGRPAYRIKKTLNGNLPFDWPVALIFDERIIAKKISRLYPFDTGGFFIKKYERFFDKASTIGDFSLEPTLETILRVVSAFYQSNYEYFTGASRKNVDIAIDQFEAIGLHEMARQPADPEASSRVPPDERASSIEAQLEEDLALSGALRAVVCPLRLMEVSRWVAALNRWSPTVIEPYSVHNAVHPEFFAGVVYSKVESALRQLGYLQ
ncbi:hypothetical protein [Mesorhizobium sp. IMUNJ 23232]|uniref:hypothetical protein n=1 Tax=Mesorhizobium sp. IMUNJ 23232 TaxID=3376064 RepID=UPI0037991D54